MAHPASADFDGQDDFVAAIRLLAADVLAATNLRPVITVRFDHEKDMALYSFDGHQFGPLRATTTAEAVMAIADLVRHDMIESPCQPWPPCPGHGHPAQAELRSGQPVWVYPGTGGQLSEIGHLRRLAPARLFPLVWAWTYRRRPVSAPTPDGCVRFRSSRSADC